MNCLIRYIDVSTHRIDRDGVDLTHLGNYIYLIHSREPNCRLKARIDSIPTQVTSRNIFFSHIDVCLSIIDFIKNCGVKGVQ